MKKYSRLSRSSIASIREVKDTEVFDLSVFDNAFKSKNNLVEALSEVVKCSIGFNQLSKRTNLGRESLYKSLGGKIDPKISTIIAIYDALNIEVLLKLKE